MSAGTKATSALADLLIHFFFPIHNKTFYFSVLAIQKIMMGEYLQ